MDDPISSLDRVVSCQDIFRVIVLDRFQWPVFPVFRIPAVHNRHRHLKISIVHHVVSDDEVAFKTADPADTDIIIAASGILIDNVFQNRPVVYPVVDVVDAIEGQIGKIVLLLASDRLL